MAVPTNLDDALDLLTATDGNQITGQDVREVVTWLATSGVAEVAPPISVTMDRNQSFDFTGSGATNGQALAVQMAATGHVSGTRSHFFVGAHSRPSVTWPDEMNVLMEDGTAFVYQPDKHLVVEVLYVAGIATGTARHISLATNYGPQIMLVVCPTAQPDTIEIWATKPTKLTLNQASLSGSMAVARTPTGIKSGNGTTRIIVQLSGALASSDVVNLVLTGSAAVDLRSRPLIAQTVAIFWYAHPVELAGFTSYRDAQYDLYPVAPVGDGTWAVPVGPNGQPVDATSIIQIYAERQPSISANGYHGARSVKCRGIPVVANHTTDLFTVPAGYGMPINDTPLMLITGFTDYSANPGVMPVGLAADTARFVVNANAGARTFQLAATQGGVALTFTSNGNDLYALFQTLTGVTTMAGLVSASASTCWAAFRGNRITTTNPGAVYNRQACVSASSTFGWSVDKGAGADTCVVGAHALDATFYQVADVPAEEGAPMLVRHRHASNQLFAKRDRLAESAPTACTNFTSLTSNIIIGARVSDMQGGCDSDIFCYVTTNSVQTAQMTEGVESFFTLQPWGRFLRHDLLDVPTTLDAVVGRTAYLYWNQVHESAGGISQYTYACSGGGTADANGWSMTPAGGDVGTRTITIVVSLGGRPVATRSFTLNILAATTTGTCRLLCIGDSWTNGFSLPDTIRASLVADGLTVTMLGSRGGRFAAVTNMGTGVWTSAGHGYTNNEPLRLFRTLEAGGTLPTSPTGDLVQDTYYYIETIDANTFGLRRTIGGARILMTSVGVGTLYTCADDERNEGRGGWKWADFWLSQSPTGGVSPFRDPSTGLWSWTYYVNTYCGGVNPDVVVLQLGINGSLSGVYPDGSTYITQLDTPTSVDAMLDLNLGHAERMIRAIRAAAPNTRIVYLNPSLQCSRQGDFRQSVGAQSPDTIAQDKIMRMMHTMNRRIWDQFGGRTADRIFVASGAVMDRTNDYATPDAFHPVPSGYTKQAQNLAATGRRALAA